MRTFNGSVARMADGPPQSATATEWTLQSDASEVSRRAASIVEPEVLWNALKLFGRSDAEAHPRLLGEEKKLRHRVRDVARLLRRRATQLDGYDPQRMSSTATKASRLLIETADRLEKMTDTSSGPAVQLLVTWRLVMEKLHSDKFTWGEIADVVLNSNRDWQAKPCPDLVRQYTEVLDGSDGRERLIDRLKKLRERNRRRVGTSS